uniref:P2X purinoreceptor 7 intracellular domain-containing protein n=1 Tax=Dicentrarchus labrax TaxID=13489 RepID=A0A8P4G5Q0_DICLA
MPTEPENVCCREVPQVVHGCLLNENVTIQSYYLSSNVTYPFKFTGDKKDKSASKPTFLHGRVCLNAFSLQKELNIYRADYGRLRLRGIEHRYRYLAYRGFVSWCWGFLGRRIHVVLPSCVVLRIRAEFPDAQGIYVGFRPALD